MFIIHLSAMLNPLPPCGGN